jgi:hypothetical protein
MTGQGPKGEGSHPVYFLDRAALAFITQPTSEHKAVWGLSGHLWDLNGHLWDLNGYLWDLYGHL